MTVDEWTESLWPILNVRPKTLLDYKRLYKRQLAPIIGNDEITLVSSVTIQRKLLTLPPQTSRHTLMLAKTIWREAAMYGIAQSNPTIGLRSPKIQERPRKFFTWEEVDERDWGPYNAQIRFLALHGLRWSEAAALEADDIHDGFVWISKSVHGAVKSKTSVRRIPYLGHFERFQHQGIPHPSRSLVPNFGLLLP